MVEDAELGCWGSFASVSFDFFYFSSFSWASLTAYDKSGSQFSTKFFNNFYFSYSVN